MPPWPFRKKLLTSPAKRKAHRSARLMFLLTNVCGKTTRPLPTSVSGVRISTVPCTPNSDEAVMLVSIDGRNPSAVIRMYPP